MKLPTFRPGSGKSRLSDVFNAMSVVLFFLRRQDALSPCWVKKSASRSNVPTPMTLDGTLKLAVEGVARVVWQDHRITSAGFRPYIVYAPAKVRE